MTERAAYIGRIRNLARAVGKAIYDSRERLGFPMAPREWVAPDGKAALPNRHARRPRLHKEAAIKTNTPIFS